MITNGPAIFNGMPREELNRKEDQHPERKLPSDVYRLYLDGKVDCYGNDINEHSF